MNALIVFLIFIGFLFALLVSAMTFVLVKETFDGEKEA